MGVLENVSAGTQPQRKKGILFGDKRSLNLESSDDLTSLSPLNEESVLKTVEARYQVGAFYSWAGVPLIALNPFKDVEELYDGKIMTKYKGVSPTEIKELPPHIFAVGQKAFCEIKRDLETRNQSIVVSGESGAGKTWTTRSLMRFITDVADARIEETTNVSRIEQRILDSNPVLEAFGNAQTTRNKNSSRFGKYIQLQFDRSQRIIGATVSTYLLEKTRVVHQAQGEGRFHIFDQITSSKHQEATLKNKESSFVALQRTKQALENIGIDNHLQSEIFKVLNGVLHLCDIEFFYPFSNMNEICTVTDDHDEAIARVCELLGTESEWLKQCLSLRRITAGSTREEFMKKCSPSECAERRDCMAKIIYSRLFDWIVDFINSSIKAPEELKHSFIGLLDIYGFENFNFNSLEQLCINYANEKLQQHFVNHFMKRQQEEYQKEGIDWSFQDFVDNRPCLDLIEGRTSVFSLMNEECRLKRELDTKSFSTRLEASLAQFRHFTCPRFRSENEEFTIHHFADSVSYQVEGLVKKNKDFIPPEVVELLQKSTNTLMQELFRFQENQDKGDGKFEDGVMTTKESSRHRQSTVTVVRKFKVSLDSLMSTLRSTNVHYIRCIKPNADCLPQVFDRKQVMAQLNACGVVETIKISAATYPIRISHHEFLKRYSPLLKLSNPTTRSHLSHPLSSPKKADASPRCPTVERLKRRCRRRHRSSYDHTRHICRSILEIAETDIDESKENTQGKFLKGVKLGRSKVFIQEDTMERLEAVRNRCLIKSVVVIQTCWRRHQKRLTRRRVNAAVKIQSVWRGWKAIKNFKKTLKAIKVIQNHARKCLMLKRLNEHKRLLTVDNYNLEKDFINETILERNSVLTENTGILLRHLSVSPLFPSGEVIKRHALPSLVSSTSGSWFNPFKTNCDEFSQNNFFWLYNKELSFNLTRNTISPLAVLISNFSQGKIPPQACTVDKQLSSKQMVNTSSAIISRRNIEKVPVTFHCRGTPLPHASTRPLKGALTNTGLAGISDMLD
ncbi:Unconventional myosin-XIX [Porites harrisoni]